MGFRTLLVAMLVGLAGCAEAVIGGVDAGADEIDGSTSTQQTADAGADASADASPDARPACEGGDARAVSPDTGHCYVLFASTTATWQGAADVCALLGPTAHLATIGDAAEDQLVIDLAIDQDAWLGGADPTEGTWTWVTGEPMTYENWGTGEPNDGGSDGEEDCMIMRKVGTDSDPTYNLDTWDDRPCDRMYTFVCELE